MRTTLLVVLLLAANAPQGALVIAHRGNGCGTVENSIDAIRASWSVGSDAVELDVRASKDGVAYLYHDDDIDGTRVSALTYAQVRLLVGRKAAPRLETALAAGGSGGFFLLDLKPFAESAYRVVIDAVADSGVADEKLVFQSDDLGALAAMRRSFPSSRFFFLSRLKRRLPFLLAPDPYRIAARLAGHPVDGISIKGRRFIDSAYVQALKNSGLSLTVWTINDPARARYYRDIGIDAVITDRPADVLDAIGRVDQPTTGCVFKPETGDGQRALGVTESPA